MCTRNNKIYKTQNKRKLKGLDVFATCSMCSSYRNGNVLCKVTANFDIIFHKSSSWTVDVFKKHENYIREQRKKANSVANQKF